jgi:hypothetical protein
MWAAFMDELRELHLGAPKRRRAKSVGAELQEGYEKIVAKRRRRRV